MEFERVCDERFENFLNEQAEGIQLFQRRLVERKTIVQQRR